MAPPRRGTAATPLPAGVGSTSSIAPRRRSASSRAARELHRGPRTRIPASSCLRLALHAALAVPGHSAGQPRRRTAGADLGDRDAPSARAATWLDADARDHHRQGEDEAEAGVQAMAPAEGTEGGLEAGAKGNRRLAVAWPCVSPSAQGPEAPAGAVHRFLSNRADRRRPSRPQAVPGDACRDAAASGSLACQCGASGCGAALRSGGARQRRRRWRP